jgi:hypothetical protein
MLPHRGGWRFNEYLVASGENPAGQCISEDRLAVSSFTEAAVREEADAFPISLTNRVIAVCYQHKC